MKSQFLRLFLVVVSVIATSSVASASAYAPSARRAPDQDYRSIIKFYESRLEQDATTASKSALSSAVPLADLDRAQMPNWPETENFELYFQNIRDERFITLNANFPRRSTWLYPDDGCYARAALSSVRTTAQKLPAPGRVFVFGNLSVETVNSESGSVSWWYHVVIGYRIGEEVFVIDPAIEPKNPLKLEDWLGRMGNTERMKVAFCSEGAYEPYSKCQGGHPLSFESALSGQTPFLRLEWDRIEDLGRDAASELGETPPWK